MEKIYLVLQESSVDGEPLFNVTPCASLNVAKSVMDKKINALLSDGKFNGLDLDKIERDQHDKNADCDFVLERNETSFYIECCYDDYFERLEIEEANVLQKI